ncbi:MAG: Hsp70 family protein [Blastocatellia bacterium]|nr:Hsp70 family protein [Blastocatellia bacterium]
MSRIVGIDLGTTNSLVAVVEQGRPRVVARGDESLTPSVVGLSDEGRIIVGQAALNQYVIAPERTIRSIKRRMGTAERVRLGERDFLPEEISSFILRHLKATAEEALGEPVDRAVITVPAYFDDAQRQATKRAGELAGLEVVRIINEPTAAALAYGIEKQAEQFLMVYDLGGGTFDVSVIEQMGDVLEVRASHGNVNLGGDDFDERVLQTLLGRLSNEHPHDFKADRRVMARLSRASERAKVALSDAPYARVAEEFLANVEGQPIHLDTELSRDDFEEMIADLLASTRDSVDRSLRDAQLTAGQIQRVLLVGGSSRIPRVAEMLHEHIGVEPAMEINPDEAVALGAAVQAAIINGEKVDAMLIDVSPHSLGVAVADLMFGQVIPGRFRPIIKRNTTIPTTKSERFFTITPEQDSVEVEVYQGESIVATENTPLGKFMFNDIPPNSLPQQNREVIIEFSYNLNGIVEVTARDHAGARREAMTVNTTASKRLASAPETRARFDEKVERDARRSLDASSPLLLALEAAERTREAKRLRKARLALEEALEGDSEPRVMEALNALDDLLYELED